MLLGGGGRQALISEHKPPAVDDRATPVDDDPLSDQDRYHVLHNSQALLPSLSELN